MTLRITADTRSYAKFSNIDEVFSPLATLSSFAARRRIGREVDLNILPYHLQ